MKTANASRIGVVVTLVSYFGLGMALLIATSGCARNNDVSVSSMGDIVVQIEQDEARRIAELQQLAMRPNWREALQIVSLPESEYAKLPAAERERLLEHYLDQAGAMKTLANAAMQKADALQRQGKNDEAGAIRESVRRLAEANSGPDTLAMINLVAQALERSLEPSAQR